MSEHSGGKDAALVEALRIARAQLNYAACPTMGYASTAANPATPAEFARNSARDDLVRLALVTCIEGAKATLDKIDALLSTRCWCGSDATSLNPAEVVVHRTDGPCTIEPTS